MAERVVVAPDKFKGSLSATDVTARVATGLALGGFGGEVVPVPVADGGDGTVAAAVRKEASPDAEPRWVASVI